MKLFLPALAFLALAGGWSQKPAERDVLIVIGGDVHGYLSPCGCTKPMSGGIRRRASAVRSLTAGRAALVLENGGLAQGIGRQDELKAEALAESLKSMGVDAINVGTRDAAMGKGMLESVSRLSGSKLVSGSFADGSTLPFTNFLVAEGFAITGLTAGAEAAAKDLGDRPLSLDEGLETALLRAKGKPLVIMLDGTEADARHLASHSGIALIVYSGQGDPPPSPIQVGTTWLVSPGEKGKSIVKFRYRGGKFSDYAVVKLGPEVPDDPAVSRAFSRYLTRVDKEALLDKLPRSPGAKLAGNPTCGTCHIDAMAKWEGTKHSGALATLEEVGHARDPDCVGCHVVELGSDKGFKSRFLTPQFTDVGCENCHGPGGDHASNPKVKMGKVGEMSCLPCHNKENSPNFDFATYWEKVKH